MTRLFGTESSAWPRCVVTATVIGCWWNLSIAIETSEGKRKFETAERETLILDRSASTLSRGAGGADGGSTWVLGGMTREYTRTSRTE